MNVLRRILDVAPVLRRTPLWSLGSFLGMILLVLAVLAFGWYFDWPRSWAQRYAPPIVILVHPCIVVPVARALRRGVEREWRASGGRLGTHCAYNVSTLPSAGTCPECGGRYDVEADTQTWANSGLTRPPPR